MSDVVAINQKVEDSSIEDALNLISMRLKALRQDRGFRLSELSTLTGLSEAFLYRVEEGERSPSLPALIKLSKVYGVSAADLFEESAKRKLRAKHSGTAIWVGPESSGSGEMVDADGNKVPFDVTSRLSEKVAGFTSPEAHIGFAFAGCFSMSLAQRLEVAGFDCKRIETKAEVKLSASANQLEISRIILNVEAEVDGVSDEALEELAHNTRKTCVVARALAAVPVTLELVRVP